MGDRDFLVDVVGIFRPGQIRIVWRDEPRPPHPELDELVARTWAEQIRQRGEGASLFNGPLARVLRYRTFEGMLEVEVGPSDYANFLATNYLHPHLGPQIGWELFSNPLGTSATIRTADGWLVQGRRNERVACHPGYVHSFGGGIEPGERRADGTFDAFASIGRELREELGIDGAEIVEQVCLGMIRDARIRQPEMIFDVAVRLTRDELAGRIAAGDEEHTRIESCRDEPGAIVAFIAGIDRIAPVAVGALLMHGRRQWGEAWLADARAQLGLSP